MKIYFDGSNCFARGAEWLTLAGVAAHHNFWVNFEDKWRAMLMERYPVAPFIHMSNLVSHDDPFERVVGWTNEKIEALVGDAVDLLERQDKLRFRLFACSIDLNASKRLTTQGHQLPKPVVQCTFSCMSNIFKWWWEHPDLNLAEQADLSFDRGETFKEPIHHHWLKRRSNPNSLVKEQNLWDQIANIEEVGMHDTPGIQVADMVAWSRSREVVNRDQRFGYLAEKIRLFVPHTYVHLDEDALHRAHRQATDKERK